MNNFQVKSLILSGLIAAAWAARGNPLPANGSPEVEASGDACMAFFRETEEGQALLEELVNIAGSTMDLIVNGADE